MPEIDFEQVVADLEPPDWDLTKAAANAGTVACFFTTLRTAGVPTKAAESLTLGWMGLVEEDE